LRFACVFTIKSAGRGVYLLLPLQPFTTSGYCACPIHAAADLMAPALSTGMLVGVSTAPAGMPQPLMAPHKAAVCTLFSRAHDKWVVFPAVANSGKRHH